jgi:Protein of unknown function (DUF2380)
VPRPSSPFPLACLPALVASLAVLGPPAARAQSDAERAVTAAVSAGGAERREAEGKTATPAPASEPMRVAVLELVIADISFNGSSPRLAEWMREQRIDPTALLREKLAEAETYRAFEDPPAVVSIGAPRIAEVLEARGVNPRTCRTECAVAVGRALGADRVVTGEVTKLSVLIWFVTGRVVDVESGRVLRQDEFEVKGVIQDMMPKVMASLARRFVMADPTPPALTLSPP